MRRLVKSLLLLVAASLIAGVQAQDAQQPNFIVIMADDLGYGDLGVYGSQLIKTPNLDRMALEGARLDSFYSSANVCTAARGRPPNGSLSNSSRSSKRCCATHQRRSPCLGGDQPRRSVKATRLSERACSASGI